MEHNSRRHRKLARDAGQPRRIDLGFGDADHVFVGHAQRELPRCCGQQSPTGSRTRVGLANRIEPIEIEARIVAVLISGQTAQTLSNDVLRRSGHGGDFGFQMRDRCQRHLMSLGRFGGRFGSGRRGVPSGAKTTQIGLDCFAVGADRRFEGLGWNGQGARAGDRAEQNRIDHDIGLPREGLEIEQQRLARVFLHRRDQALRIVAAIAHRDLFDYEIRAAGRCDSHGAIGCGIAAGHGTAGFHQFTRDKEVDVADRRGQRQNRSTGRSVAARRDRHRHHLDMVGGRAGTLRDARN